MSIWQDYLELLKVINCMGKDEWHKALAVTTWSWQEEFEQIWEMNRKNGLFNGLCLLDEKNVDLLFEYAKAKYKKNQRT